MVVEEEHILVLVAPAPAASAHVWLVCKEVDLAQRSGVAVLDVAPIFESGRQAVSDVAAEIQILEPGFRYLPLAPLAELVKARFGTDEPTHLRVQPP